MKFKIAVIGCGHIADVAHGPAYKKYALENEGVELTACCDINGETAASFAKKYLFKNHYTDYNEMLKKEKPDAVCVLVPPAAASKVAAEVLLKGFPVLVEKPPGLTARETSDIIDASQKTGAPVKVAFNRRYMPVVRKLKYGYLGGDSPSGVTHVDLTFYRKNRLDDDFSTTAIHGIDTVRYIVGSDYEYISFKYNRYEGKDENVVSILMYCKFKSGATAQMSFCPVSGVNVERLSVSTGNDMFMLQLSALGCLDFPGGIVHYSRGSLVGSISGDYIAGSDEVCVLSGFYGENKAFFDFLRHGSEMDCDIETAVQSVEVTHCIRNREPEYLSR